jgi:hypothetical protein
MTTQTQNKDLDLLDELQKVALDYGVRRIEQFPIDNRLEITYHVIGQGSAISDLITTKMQELVPEHDYRIKMIPSDKKLIVELL